MRRFTHAVCFLLGSFLCGSAAAQWQVEMPVGSAFGHVGVISPPNEVCRGPATIIGLADNSVAVLDKVNAKVLVIGAKGAVGETMLPDDLVEPQDILQTEAGFLVTGALGDVVLVDVQGGILARTQTKFDPNYGMPRLVVTEEQGVALKNLRGDLTNVDLDPQVVGKVLPAGTRVANSYASAPITGSSFTLFTNTFSGPLAEMEITSSVAIGTSTVIWAEQDQGALVAVQENQRLPEEASFVRLIEFNSTGNPTQEAYLRADAFACDARRPFARTTDGTVVVLSFGDQETVGIKVVDFVAFGTGTPAPIVQDSTNELINADDDVFTALERLNGTSSVSSIAMSPISRRQVLSKAVAALNATWVLGASNYSHSGVLNRCRPPSEIWERPARLEGRLGQTIVSVPYKWGGHLNSLDRFHRRLADGRLAGDVCTCRDANCVHPDALGLDCSGFVSYAWQTPAYYTTARLPERGISRSIKWADLGPGDIVNRQYSHVRLVESVASGPDGRIITVIESAANDSCGGVCRRSYSENDLRNEGYKPLRRVGIID